MDSTDQVGDRPDVDVAAVGGGRGGARDGLALAAAERDHRQTAVVEREIQRPQSDPGLDADERPGWVPVPGRRRISERRSRPPRVVERGVCALDDLVLERREPVQRHRPAGGRVSRSDVLERPATADRAHAAAFLRGVRDHADERLKAVRHEVPLADHRHVAQPVSEPPVLELVAGERRRGTRHGRLLWLSSKRLSR
jgi:hypothetical protein